MHIHLSILKLLKYSLFLLGGAPGGAGGAPGGTRVTNPNQGKRNFSCIPTTVITLEIKTTLK